MSGLLYALLIVLGIAGWPEQPQATGPRPAAPAFELDRIAVAVEGAESSRGTDPSMWRSDRSGPQGPMQVSAAAAQDVGGGDRFDSESNRRLGRAYLALLHSRYGNWADAVAAYNWGPGNFDRWAAGGRATEALSGALKAYLDRVMREFSADAPADAPPQRTAPEPPLPGTIKDPKRRKTYAADLAALKELRELLETSGSAQRISDRTMLDTKAVEAAIRRVAARPGYEEFMLGNRPAAAPPPNPAALRKIAEVMVGKLQSECAAIVLVERQHKP